jgi:hypothetical protein
VNTSQLAIVFATQAEAVSKEYPVKHCWQTESTKRLQNSCGSDGVGATHVAANAPTVTKVVVMVESVH